jgi:hypothetical protein
MDLNMDKFLKSTGVDDAKKRIKEYQNYGLTKYFITNKYELIYYVTCKICISFKFYYTKKH